MKKTFYMILVCAVLLSTQCALENSPDDYIGSRRAENVRDLSPVEANYVVVPDATTVQYLNKAEEVKKIKTGDIIVSDVNSNSPNGFIKKVTAVTESAGSKTITAEPVSITEAVVDGQATAEGTLNPAGDNSLLTGATYNTLNGRIETITPDPGITVYGTRQPVNAIPECKSKKWYVEFNNVNIQNSGTINGCIGMDLKFLMNMKIKSFELKNAEFSVNPSIVTKLSTNLNGTTFDISRAQVTLTTFNLQPITFTIGFVPVVIVPRIKLVLGVDGKITASLSTSLQYSASAKAGITYANKTWTPIREKSSTYNFVPPVFSGNVNAMIYTGPEVTFLFYGVAGPGANLYIYTHFNVAWDSAQNRVQKWDVWLGFEAGAHFTIEVFGRTLFKINEPSLLGYEGLIASSDFSGIAPPGTGRVTGVLGQAISGSYQKPNGTSGLISGDFVTVGKLVGSLSKK